MSITSVARTEAMLSETEFRLKKHLFLNDCVFSLNFFLGVEPALKAIVSFGETFKFSSISVRDDGKINHPGERKFVVACVTNSLTQQIHVYGVYHLLEVKKLRKQYLKPQVAFKTMTIPDEVYLKLAPTGISQMFKELSTDEYKAYNDYCDKLNANDEIKSKKG